jgi:hypothetical protein
MQGLSSCPIKKKTKRKRTAGTKQNQKKKPKGNSTLVIDPHAKSSDAVASGGLNAVLAPMISNTQQRAQELVDLQIGNSTVCVLRV